MDIIVDTHALLWYISGDKQLSKKVLSVIDDEDNKCFVSIASIWEIAIKLSINKLQIKGGFEKILDFLDNNDFDILEIKMPHILQLLKLPHHHKDPFDRIIILQAIDEKLSIISIDDNFDNYNVKIIWD